MQDNYKLILYDSWNLEKISIPSRSRLYPLEPMGLGTPSVESLTSYITRLAKTHCVLPGILMEREFAQLVNKTYGSTHLHKIYNFTGALNGTGVMATDLVQTVQSLTWREDIRYLTMLTWSDLFPSRNLLRSIRAWCPICYEEWRTSKKIIYEPLLWFVDAVTVCQCHHISLTQKCPHCNQKNLPLAWRSQPGYCAKCGQWLGLSFDNNLSDGNFLSEDRLKQEIWITSTVGDLLAAANWISPPSPEIIALALSSYVKQLTEGNVAAFARQIQAPRNTVWLWCQGKNSPSLKALVRICYSLGISILELLNPDSVNDCLLKPLPQARLQTEPRKSSKKFEVDKVRQYLETILANNHFPPPSMEEVARCLGYDRRTIYRHFRDLCRAISTQYISYQKRYVHEAIEQCCEEVRQIVLWLHEQGKYPTEAAVSKLISRPGYFRYKKVRAVLDEARYKLGL